MDLTHVGLVLAVSTAWATLFLGVLGASALRLHSWEILKACGAWIVVALSSPRPIIHCYFILALVCLVSWVHVRRERLLAGKVWLSVAASLGISLGVVFFLQAAPALCPANLAPRDYLLLLASIYLGGAVTGLAYVGWTISRSPDTRVSASGYARLLVGLTLSWIAVVGAELRLAPNPLPHLHAFSVSIGPRVLLAPMIMTAALSCLAIQTVRSHARAGRFFAAVAVLALGTQWLERWMLL